MANLSDWISQANSVAPCAPDWIAVLGDAQGARQGFQEGSPFARQTPTDPAPDRALPGQDSEHDPLETAFQAGFAEGQATAERAAQTALAQHKEQLRDLRVSFRALDQAAREALAQDLNLSVLTLCEQVLGDYALDRDALIARCRAAAARLGAGPSDLSLHLHPETLASLGSAALDGWTLVEDPSLAPGTLRMTCADGAVHEGPADWMRAISQALSE